MEFSHTYLLVGFLILLPTLFGYMVWEARTVDVTTLYIDGAPQGIVFVSDPHLKDSNIEHVRNTVREINALHPSVVLVGGDFANGKETDFGLHSIWSEIDAPVYAVLGNHDYRVGATFSSGLQRTIAVSMMEFPADGYDVASLRGAGTDTAFADALVHELEKSGVRVLRNEYVDLSIDGEPLRIVGVDDAWAGMADPPAVPPTDAFTVYLIHEPQCRAAWDGDLILSGHTHGGQFIVPLLSQINNRGIVELFGFQHRDGPPTYITRGICGSSVAGVDLRFNSRPEIVIINPANGTAPA